MITILSKTTLIRCLRCQTPYDWRKSSSQSLKMTYCGFICELADNGCTIEDLLLIKKEALS